jgi:hypothetical protein
MAKAKKELTKEQLATIAELSKKSISELAEIIANDWKNPYFGAVPYLDAMYSLQSINDGFGADSGKSIILYFMCNAQTWRGPIAKAVKAELDKRSKACKRG